MRSWPFTVWKTVAESNRSVSISPRASRGQIQSITIQPRYCRGVVSAETHASRTVLRIPSAPTTISACLVFFVSPTWNSSSRDHPELWDIFWRQYPHLMFFSSLSPASNSARNDCLEIWIFLRFEAFSFSISTKFLTHHSPMIFPAESWTTCLVEVTLSLRSKIPSHSIALLACCKVSP